MQEITENNTNIIERLLKYIDYKGETFNKLALNIHVSNSYFSKMRKSKGSLGSDIIEKILLYYDDLSSNWLLTGKGEMLNPRKDSNYNSIEISGKDNTINEAMATYYNSKNQSKNQNIKGDYPKEIEYLEKELYHKEEIIELLKKQLLEKDKYIHLLESSKK